MLSLIKSSEPSFSDIMQVYFANENLDGEDLRGWPKKIKTAPYLPTLYVGFDHQIRQTQSQSVKDNISVTSGIVTVGPADNNYDFNNNFGSAMHVRAVWNLDELIFNRYDVELFNARQANAKTRAGFSADIYKIYEGRYLCLEQYLELKQTGSHKAGVFYAKFLALTDRLNEITRDTFQNKFWREK